MYFEGELDLVELLEVDLEFVLETEDTPRVLAVPLLLLDVVVDRCLDLLGCPSLHTPTISGVTSCFATQLSGQGLPVAGSVPAHLTLKCFADSATMQRASQRLMSSSESEMNWVEGELGGFRRGIGTR